MVATNPRRQAADDASNPRRGVADDERRPRPLANGVDTLNLQRIVGQIVTNGNASQDRKMIIDTFIRLAAAEPRFRPLAQRPPQFTAIDKAVNEDLGAILILATVGDEAADVIEHIDNWDGAAIAEALYDAYIVRRAEDEAAFALQQCQSLSIMRSGSARRYALDARRAFTDFERATGTGLPDAVQSKYFLEGIDATELSDAKMTFRREATQLDQMAIQLQNIDATEQRQLDGQTTSQLVVPLGAARDHVGAPALVATTAPSYDEALKVVIGSAEVCFFCNNRGHKWSDCFKARRHGWTLDQPRPIAYPNDRGGEGNRDRGGRGRGRGRREQGGEAARDGARQIAHQHDGARPPAHHLAVLTLDNQRREQMDMFHGLVMASVGLNDNMSHPSIQVWIVDSGCARHTAPDEDGSIRSRPLSGENVAVSLDAGQVLHRSPAEIDWAGHTAGGPPGHYGPPIATTISRVLVTPSIKYRLLSTSQMLADTGTEAHFTSQPHLLTRNGVRIPLVAWQGLFALVVTPHDTNRSLSAVERGTSVEHAQASPSPFAHIVTESRGALAIAALFLGTGSNAFAPERRRLAVRRTAAATIATTIAAEGGADDYKEAASAAPEIDDEGRIRLPPMFVCDGGRVSADEDSLLGLAGDLHVDFATLLDPNQPDAYGDRDGTCHEDPQWCLPVHTAPPQFGSNRPTQRRPRGMPTCLDMRFAHGMCGHASDSRTRATMHFYGLGVECGHTGPCAACAIANQLRKPHHATTTSQRPEALTPGTAFDVDIAGPFSTGYGGVVFAADFADKSAGSTFVHTEPLAHKSDLIVATQRFVADMAARGVKVSLLEFDFGGENINETMRAACATMGVSFETAPADRKLAAGERVHERLNSATRAAIVAAAPHVSIRDWPFVRSWSAYVLNATVPTNTELPPPFTAVFPNATLDVSAWLPIGSQVAIVDEYRKRGLVNRSIVGTYLGMDSTCGPGTAVVRTVGGTIRRTTSFTYIAAPGAHLDYHEAGRAAESNRSTPTNAIATTTAPPPSDAQPQPKTPEPPSTSRRTSTGIPTQAPQTPMPPSTSRRTSTTPIPPSTSAPKTPMPSSTSTRTTPSPPRASELSPIRPTPQGDDAIEVQQTNPKKIGSASHKRYESYKSATTAAEYQDLGGRAADMRHDYKRGYVRHANTDMSPELSAAAIQAFLDAAPPPQHDDPHIEAAIQAMLHASPPPQHNDPHIAADDDQTVWAMFTNPFTTDDLSGNPPVRGAEASSDVRMNTDFDDVAVASAIIDAATGGGDAPANLREAMNPTNVDLWQPAIQKQMDSFAKHNTLRHILRSDAPPGVKKLRMGSNFRLTRDGRAKARIYAAELRGSRDPVAPGEAGPHVPQFSSPSPGFTAVKTIVAHASHYRNVLVADDVVDAYLNGAPRDKPIYAYYPASWDLYMYATYGDDRSAWPYDPETHMCEIIGNMWGTVDAAHIWNADVDPVIVAMGFVATPLNEALYVRREDDDTTSALLLWTDDVVVSASDERANEILTVINTKYKTKGRRVLGTGDADLLALDVQREDDGGYSLSMVTYETSVIHRLNFENANASPTPLPPKWNADPTDDSAEINTNKVHKWANPAMALGMLTFACYIIRIDLAFAVSALATAISVWTIKHDAALSRAVRYLKGSLGKKITYPGGMPISLDGYVDASYANELHTSGSGRARSRIGGVLRLGPSLLWYFTGRTKTTPLSTAEAELIGLVRFLRGLVVIRATIQMMFLIDHLEPTIVHEDNLAVIAMLRRRIISGRARHVRVAIGYVLDVLDSGLAVIKFVRTTDQLANGLTKSESKEEHRRTCAAFFST